MTGKLVLIVEDNSKNLKLVSDVLQYHGFRTLGAGTAAEGIALAEQSPPDLILMDIQLPDMDGITALGHLRASAKTSAIPVVAFTALAMAVDRDRILAAGFDGYLVKPIDIHEFPEQVRQYCEPR